MIVIKMIIFYFIIGLLIWIGLLCTDQQVGRPKFWRFSFAWGPSLLSHKIGIWIWKNK
jgi:hypothetical protein